MYHPDFCSCGRDRSPCPPSQPGGFLMQQIVGAGRVWLRYERFCLPVSELPCDARAPLQLTNVSVPEGGIRCERCTAPCRGALTLNAHIPLRLTLADASGCCLSARSAIEVAIPMRLCGAGDPSRACTAINAFVRLARPCGCVEGDRAQAWLDVCAEAWLTACRPVYGQGCAPLCAPQLPLYPQPCRRG